MTQAAFDQTFEQRLAKLDLRRVMEKLAMESNMSKEDLAVAEDLYRKFLTLKAKNPQIEMAPPVIVDRVWDLHVMFTRDYYNDCMMLFGEFLHHTPHVESDDFDVEPLFANTRNLFKQQYGYDFTRQGLRADYIRAALCS